jgi:hypothetical protein
MGLLVILEAQVGLWGKWLDVGENNNSYFLGLEK